LWKVCTEHVVTLKEEILARDGKLVIRPDSGDPVDILCGTIKENTNTLQGNIEDAIIDNRKDGVDGLYPHQKGVIELLWDVFGGTVNEQGYKVLDSHIGAIYGDSITIDRANEICRRLADKGFASTNVVLGIGSFTYQYNTRDTFGFAMKATYVEINGEGREIFKDPITDDGTKKSATGLLCVEELPDGKIGLYDKVTWNTEDTGLLQTIYKDGVFYNQTTLTEIRKKISNLIQNKNEESFA
jgi:nicotinamide phosphoribosyltransferase